MTKRETLAEAVGRCLNAQYQVNGQTSAPAAAVLWPDKEGEWLSAVPSLRRLVPGLCSLGAYDPTNLSGPAIWLKSWIAGALPEPPFSGTPVVYLPGVSRAELRAIESCPRELQPLAELQYRGVFWSQANAKDWSLNAFLSSKNGGLGLEVAQDQATREALAQALRGGVLLEQSIEDLRGRTINAEWLHSLLAPNPPRDLLMWMNDPAGTRAGWDDVRWEVFSKRCVADFGFDPVADGERVAAGKLAEGRGKWAAVLVQYRDSFGSFPKVFDLLASVQPPQLGLFPEPGQLAGYPQANESQESALRYTLSACAAMAAPQAREAIQRAEREHAERRDWLWCRMGQAPLAMALQHLVRVAEMGDKLPTGTSLDALAESYKASGWFVDEAAMQALAAVQSKLDVEAVSKALRVIYLPWLEESAKRVQEAAQALGGLPKSPMLKAEPGLCTLFVDGLRYDVATRLQKRLEALGSVSLSSRWTSLPSVTASGKAWCSPVAALIAGTKDDTEFAPRVAADSKPLSAHHFRKLLGTEGVAFLDDHDSGDPAESAWAEMGDLDHYGHAHGMRLARDIDHQLGQVVGRLEELVEAGWKRLRVVTDHGWLLLPGGLPKTELAKHQAETRWGRCAVLKDSALGTPLTFGWDWCADVQVAYAPGVGNFTAGEEYAHGGISFQESLVPVLDLEVAGASISSAKVTITQVSWKGLRCIVEVDSALSGMSADIRLKPAVADSSIVAAPKPLDSGKANLAVADDGLQGSAAVIVVLGPGGEVLQQLPTMVGDAS